MVPKLPGSINTAMTAASCKPPSVNVVNRFGTSWLPLMTEMGLDPVVLLQAGPEWLDAHQPIVRAGVTTNTILQPWESSCHKVSVTITTSHAEQPQETLRHPCSLQELHG